MNFYSTRRHWLQHALFGAGLLGLRSIASGVPTWVLRNPEAFAANLTDDVARSMRDAVRKAQFLILSMSDEGEPINGNVPGMYLGQGFRHPTAPAMAETTFSLGSQSVKAAAVWSTLSASTRQRTSFFHHATFNFAHGDYGNVHQLNGRVDDGEYMVSAFSKVLSQTLGTIQTQPINITGASGKPIKFEGKQQPVFSPTFLKSLLLTPPALSAYKSSQALRDADLGHINTLIKSKRSSAQTALLDAWATSQSQVRRLPETLLDQVTSLNDDSEKSQLAGAVMLSSMKLAPVVLVHLCFGGDNHNDTDDRVGPGQLPQETASHVKSVAGINSMVQVMAASSMQDKITFATLSTFGRSNAMKNLSGRHHNGLHTCSLIVGPNVKAGVVGGAKLIDINPVATAIDSATGHSQPTGDIAFEDTLAAYGKTLGMACGITSSQVDTMISGGTAVQGALTGV